MCPTNCSCDQLSACGKPYLQPKPLTPGEAITMSDCSSADAATRWKLLDSAWPSRIASADNDTLCWAPAGKSCTGCMKLAGCADAVKFSHARNGNLVSSETGECVDLAGASLGSWACGADQPNQRWAVDKATGEIISGASGYSTEAAFAGECASVAH